MELKRKLFKFLPASIQKEIKYKYYFKKFSNASINDEKDLRILKKLIKPGDTVIDIGANFGLYTKFLSEATGNTGKVFSFEPVPGTFDILKNNINKSKLNNVTIFKKAISDKNGEAFIFIPEYKDGSENYYEASLQNATQENGIRIETIRLDDWLSDKINNIDFIKMDVEGHEPQALSGAEKILSKFHPKLMIEINDGFEEGSTGKKVLNFLSKFNYEINYFDGSTLRKTDGNEEGVNFIFL